MIDRFHAWSRVCNGDGVILGETSVHESDPRDLLLALCGRICGENACLCISGSENLADMLLSKPTDFLELFAEEVLADLIDLLDFWDPL
jgi:hypothetical protein